jgi:hypothetical protein
LSSLDLTFLSIALSHDITSDTLLHLLDSQHIIYQFHLGVDIHRILVNMQTGIFCIFRDLYGPRIIKSSVIFRDTLYTITMECIIQSGQTMPVKSDQTSKTVNTTARQARSKVKKAVTKTSKKAHKLKDSTCNYVRRFSGHNQYEYDFACQ